MFGPLGLFGFGAPWVLAALVALPAIWYLLRVVPPSPRRQSFPPLRLLMGLAAREDSAARTPPWLLLLRLLAVLLAILGLAQPVLNPQPSGGVASDRPLLLVIDDGWGAAAAWEERRAALDAILDRAALRGQPVRVLTIAPPADGGPVAVGRLGTAEDARAVVRGLTPKPWAADPAAGLLDPLGAAEAVVVSSGLRQDGTADLIDALRRHGPVTVVEPPAALAPLLLGPPERTADGLSVPVHRPAGDGVALPERLATVQAVDEDGRPVGAGPAQFAAGQATATARILLPPDLRGTLARVEVRAPGGQGAPGAGGVLLLDDRWQRRPVAVVPGEQERAGVPLLSDTYYVRRALEPFAEVTETTLAQALEQRLSVLMISGGGRLSAGATQRLEPWVEAGGVLVRFAGPQMADGPGLGQAGREDTLLPVALRGGGRTLGGVLSWSEPATLAPFPDDGPFAGLAVPPEVTVTSQVLAEPSVDLPQRTWARLSDGTPLVTGARRGQGWVVLVHTTANAEWSNLALSGLFPEMLRRLTGLGQGTGEAGAAAGPQPALETLDGFGRLGDPPPTARALVGGTAPPGPAHPPGYYGRADQRTALNLSGADAPPAGLGTLPPGVERTGFAPAGQAVDLRPWFLGAALALLLLDLLISYGLRGLLGRRGRMAAAGAGAVLAVLAAAPHAARAQDADTFALEAALDTRLAYVRTGLGDVDRTAEEGLAALTSVLGDRSSAELAPPMGLDINSDELAFFPLIYWPAAAGQEMPDAAARERVGRFLGQGGMIVFDGRGQENADALRDLLTTLDIPPLAPLPDDHVATRSFYLLPGLPGRVDGGPVWISQSAAARATGTEAVSPVIIGANDWAGAWARDASGRPRQPVVPGGERGREIAYRAGVNMVMYALTGNYKADQVHLPAILERLTQ
ncbi:DUF4159 domain-containing protein [Novispirillum sp. DQ9]|uniref:DUF4159 domain-containing protein n=1 Tax=Novispirillum sp. DQ9 TaxID=3398612 RepID=UPI003C79916A